MKNSKETKSKQLFLILLLFSAFLTVMCFSGCGGKFEKPLRGHYSDDSINVVGCSIPGIGGCLTSGEGCNTACWPQSCKIVRGTLQDENYLSEEINTTKLIGCDSRYYRNGCAGGCGQQEKSCYGGCIKMDGTYDINGIFYGSSDSGEKYIGCANGCAGCVGSDGDCASLMYSFEGYTGIG